MSCNTLLLGILIGACIVLFFIHCNKNIEGLENRPNDNQRKQITNDILSNKELFTSRSSNLDILREKFSWIDPIIYEDIKTLAYKKSLSEDNIKQLFTV